MTCSLYIHIPFCEVKCGYCDFFSVPRGHDDFPLQQEYTNELIREIETRAADFSGQPILSIFFGGGTPSLLDPKLLEKILSRLGRHFSWTPETEITLEANPKTVSRQRLAAFRSLGVNRLSIGVQSFQEKFLRVMGRIHSGDEAKRTVEDALAVGFENVSLDLIYGLPHQTFTEFEYDLKSALTLGTPHFSAYNLTVEEGTPFAKLYAAGKLSLPEDNLQAEMFEKLDATAEEGFVRYEISNFSRVGFECRHNLNYWDYGEYVGFGAGAVSFIASHKFLDALSPLVDAPRRTTTVRLRHSPRDSSPQGNFWDAPSTNTLYGYRRQNVRDLKRYLTGQWEQETEAIPLKTAMGEYLMMGLRKREGVFLSDFHKKFAWDLEKIYQDQLPPLLNRGWLVQGKGRLFLSDAGWVVANEVMEKFF